MLTAGQCLTAAYIGDGYILCASCAQKRIEDWLVENGYDFEDEQNKAVAEWRKENGAPDLWRRDRIYSETNERLETLACEALGFQPLSQYQVDSDWSEDGLACDDCSEWLVEPAKDRCEEDL